MTSTFKTAKTNLCPQPGVVKASTCRLPQAFHSHNATSKASTKVLPGRRRAHLEQQINASGDAQEALADRVDRLVKLRAPAPPTASKRGRMLRPVHQETLECKMGRQSNFCIPSRAHWMTEYKENFGFSQTVPSPSAKKTVVPLLTTSLLDHPEARFADKFRRTEYQTAYSCKLRTSHFNHTLFRQIHGKA